MLSRNSVLFGLLMVVLTLNQPAQALSPSRQLGKGSYATERPRGTVGPQAVIYRTENLRNIPMPTNDWWSSLAWKRNNTYSENMFAHPLAFKANGHGLGISYPREVTISRDGRFYEYPYLEDMTIGVAGLDVPFDAALVDAFSDWTVTVNWGNSLFKATFGHGLPFVYASAGGNPARIIFASSPTVHLNADGVIHVTVNGHEYGIFGPQGSVWQFSEANVLQSDLNGKDYFSVAILPDATEATFEFYRNHAYAFVTETHVTWNYDESDATVTTTFQVTTEVKEGLETRPLLALYRHQWLYTDAVHTSYEYVSPRGSMKVIQGDGFVTRMTYHGILPYLPDLGSYDRETLYRYVDTEFRARNLFKLPGPDGSSDTYWTGKGMGRVAQLIPIADQIGHREARDYFLTQLKTLLEAWFTAEAGETRQLFYYDANWGTLIGYPDNYGTAVALNDHHFHYGYFIMAAAMVSLYDPEWALPGNWGGMVELLIKDAENWDRDTQKEPLFSFLRSFDPYAGHSWAAGDATYPNGNNQESSSESMQFASALILWGESTANKAIRDLGIYLYTTEAEAVHQYWFDVDNAVFPEGFSHTTIGILWGNGGHYNTWWTASVEEIHGINFLPFNGGSLYLGYYPDYIAANYQEIVNENNGVENSWTDLIWQFQALQDAPAALAKFNERYTPEWGASRAHTYHWLHNLNMLGQVERSVTADNPLSAVFNKAGVRTYIAYNTGSVTRVVTFSDGTRLELPARSMQVFVK